MVVIGLTGGIGTGKSTVSGVLKEKGYSVIDADLMAHRMTEKGSPVLKKIAVLFGDDMLRADGSLDRKRLASVVFADKEKLEQLENITTKVICDRIKKQLYDLRRSGRCGIIFVDAPLLFETGLDGLADFVWVVTADDDKRVERVMKRDGISEKLVRDRIYNQMRDDEKIKGATDIIDNSGNEVDLLERVEELLNKYDRA